MKTIILLSFFYTTSLAFAYEAAFDKAKTLSLEEQNEADDYIHLGIVQKKYDQLCSSGRKNLKDICTNKQAFEKNSNLAKLDKLLPAVLKGYSIVMNSSIITNAVTKTVGKEVVQTNQPDYCSMIASAGEAGASLLIKMNNEKQKENIKKSSSKTRQAASFYALAKSHKSMAKTSKVQSGIWASAAACYGGLLAVGSTAGGTGWKVNTKLAASVLVSGFFLKKAKAHSERAKLIEQMARELPGGGQCNPITETTCFCNEDSSANFDPTNYQKYCIPSLLVGRGNLNEAFVCVDAHKKTDPACHCAKNDTCIDSRVKAGLISFGASPTLLRNTVAGIKPVSDGFTPAQLAAVDSNNRAFAKRQLKAFKTPKNAKLALSKNQTDIAKEIAKQGIPKLLAADIARQKSSAKIPATLGGVNTIALSAAPSKSKIEGDNRSFQSGNKIRKKRNKKSSRYARQAKNKKKNAIEIFDFAQKAQREAEITEDKSRGIFDIISRRYQTSAWENFKVLDKIEQ